MPKDEPSQRLLPSGAPRGGPSRWGALAWALLIGFTVATNASAEALECLIEPAESVVVAAPQIGVVSGVEVERGDVVIEGQVLATLESSTERASVALAKARAATDAAIKAAIERHELQKHRVERGRELLKGSVLSQVQLLELQSEMLIAAAAVREARDNRRLAELELVRAEATLELKTIRSPLDGVVVDVMLSKGEYADPPQVLELAKIHPLHVEAYAPISLLEKIEVGDTATVFVEEPVGGSQVAHVTVVDPVVDGASGTFGLRLELPNPEHRPLAGLRCRLELASPDALAAERPEAAPAAAPQPEPSEDDTALAGKGD